MPKMIKNPHRGSGFLPEYCLTKSDATAVQRLLALCPAHRETPLVSAPSLAADLGVAEVWVKDESQRMGLGSFKALGAAFVIAAQASATGAKDLGKALAGQVFVAASAGNHGLSVAAGARIFGAQAVIYLAHSVPESFADRLRAKGAQVVRAGATYEDSMQAATEVAKEKGWTLLSDSSWPGYTDIPLGVMEGYLNLAAEAVSQIPEPPTHIFLQAGVGGLAAALAAMARAVWGDAPIIFVVEAEAAPALFDSIQAGQLVETTGPVSSMGRLDCKTASIIALASLSRDADRFVTLTEAEAADGVSALAGYGFATSPSGGAGLAALITGVPGLTTSARVLTILSEGAETA